VLFGQITPVGAVFAVIPVVIITVVPIIDSNLDAGVLRSGGRNDCRWCGDSRSQHCFNSSAQLTGTLTLNGSGIYVFKMGTTLTTASNSSVVLAKGATAGNVFWQVGSSATLGTNTAFEGSILANISDTVTTGVSVTGRVFALTGAVTQSGSRIRAASK